MTLSRSRKFLGFGSLGLLSLAAYLLLVFSPRSFADAGSIGSSVGQPVARIAVNDSNVSSIEPAASYQTSGLDEGHYRFKIPAPTPRVAALFAIFTLLGGRHLFPRR